MMSYRGTAQCLPSFSAPWPRDCPTAALWLLLSYFLESQNRQQLTKFQHSMAEVDGAVIEEEGCKFGDILAS